MRPLRFILTLLLLISSGYALIAETPALKKLRHDAEQGDPFAQYNRGVMYDSSVPRDYTESIFFLVCGGLCVLSRPHRGRKRCSA